MGPCSVPACPGQNPLRSRKIVALPRRVRLYLLRPKCDLMNFELAAAPSPPASGVNILGVSAYYHDSSACLVRDGSILAAAQEERFTRKKHDAAFPAQAVDYCLRAGRISIKEVAYVTFYEKPFLK